MNIANILQGSQQKKEQVVTIFVFLLPWIIALVVCWDGPILYTVALSFMKYKMIGGGSFIGFENYIKVFNDPYF